jgi:hypothetical protein
MRKAAFATFALLRLIACGIVMTVALVGVGRAQSQTTDVQQPKLAALMAVIIDQGRTGRSEVVASGHTRPCCCLR